MADRYDTADQDATEPGSDGQVLRNKLGITRAADMDEAELVLLEDLYENILTDDLPDRQLTANDIKTWHRRWLGNVYDWAGQERAVNMGKQGFQFASAHLIPALLDQFEERCLGVFTPCHGMKDADLHAAIATTHVEFILIHPFREGNGRLSRLLADVMACQAGHNPLDYSTWDADKQAYIGAIHAGLGGDYGPMTHWVGKACG